MARVMALVRVLPEGLEVDLDTLAKKINDALPENYLLAEARKEPIAFGLEALLLLVVMPEETEGGTYELEQRISAVEGVSEVEILRVTRAS